MLLLCCNKEARDGSDQRTGNRAIKIHDRSAASTGKHPKNSTKPTPDAGNTAANDYSQLIADNAGQLTRLIDYCVNHVPDSKKSDFMILIAEAAGRKGDVDFLNSLLELNPGSIKNIGIEAYVSNVNGNAEIMRVLGFVTEELLPEEKESIWKGIVSPMMRLPARELATLFEDGAIPVEFSGRVGHIVGINLGQGDINPTEARSIIQRYPNELQQGIEAMYWSQLSAKNPDMAKQAFEAGSVPKTSWVTVGRSIANQIIRDDSFNAALNYALARKNNDQEESLSNHVFDLWMKSDSITASERAAQLPPGPALDGAARAIALRLEKLRDLENAERWKALIREK